MPYLICALLLFAQAPDSQTGDATAIPEQPADAQAQPNDTDDENTEPADSESGDESPSVEALEDDDDIEESEDGGVFDLLDDVTKTGALGFLRQGGLFMWPILLMGILASGVIIERYRSLKMLTSDSGGVREEVLQLLREDRIEDALNSCDREQGPVPAILAAGLRKFLILRRLNYDAAKIEEQVVKAMDDYGVHIVAALEKHLSVLATISSVAPMLGFLGTVAGMITSFEEIVAKMGETNIVEAAAGGISVALLTTAFGLIIGIPAFMAFNYFTSVINRFVLEVEESATDLIEAVTLQIALESKPD